MEERRIFLFKTPRFDVAEMMKEDSEEEEGGDSQIWEEGGARLRGESARVTGG